MPKDKVVILGGGLSALSAGIHLLQEGGADRFEVKVLCMEHRLGGKAASYPLGDGRYMEIGFHGVFGYYTALQTLLARAGHAITDERWFTPNEGVHLMYEAGARAVNRLDIPSGALDVAAFFGNGFVGYDGMSFAEKVETARFFATVGAKLLLREVPPEIDEYSFTAWCVSEGLDLELTKKSWFRYILDLAFNFPAEGSAYVGAYGFQRLMGPENSTVYYLNGPLNEVIVEPIARLFIELGGTIEFCTKATRIELEPGARRVQRIGVRAMADVTSIANVVDRVDPVPLDGSYSLSDDGYPTGDPSVPTSSAERVLERGRDFDRVISALPVDSLRVLLRTTPRFAEAVLDVADLAKIWHLRSVASISLRLWVPDKVVPADYATVVMGTPQPCATLIDYTNCVDALRSARWGSIIELEGQEGLHTDLSDEEIVRELVAKMVELPFVDRARLNVDKLLAQTDDHHYSFRRNTAHHLRYLLMEPGHWKYRPRQHERFYENLTLTGDWMRGTQPTASMEAAVRTGRVAANLVRADVGLAEVDA